MRTDKKVLIAAPTSERHDYVFEEWLEAINNQSYKNFDVLVVYTGTDDKYARYLQSKGIIVLFDAWDSSKNVIVQHLAHSREMYRLYAVENNYDYIFHVDTDTILPVNAIEELMAFNVDQVGYVVQVYPKEQYQPPCVFSSGEINMNQGDKNGLNYYSWSWVYKYKGQLRKVYASALGVLLVKRRVFENVHFRTHPTFINGEDLWYYAEADEKGYEAYCYVKRIPHKNCSWNNVCAQEKGKAMKMFIAHGPEDAKEAVMVNAN